MTDQYYDALLNVKTVGDQRGFNTSLHYYRYEPTPYNALEILFQQYELKSSDRVVDFGCGKGRLIFYLNYLFNASAMGIEMNETFYKDALENQLRYLKKMKNRKDKLSFTCCLAQEYLIKPAENRFYFFNPFSVQIFMSVINNILQSVETNQREVEIVLYYPSEDYIYFLETSTAFELKAEIVLPGMYEHNPNERFLIYHLE